MDFKFFSQILKYKLSNPSLFNDLVINKFGQKKIKIFKSFLLFFLEIEFLFRRSFVLINDIFFGFKIDEIYRFPNIGFPDIYETKNVNVRNICSKKFGDFKELYMNHNLVDLETKIKNECEEKLKNLSINKKDKIVCLHVRDGNFRKDHNRKSYRNSNVNNYTKAIQYLINKGFWVIRIGDAPTKKVKFKNNKFIDYPYSKIKSEQMDLFLIQRSSFYIGAQSGPMEVAYLFNKPVLLTNMVQALEGLPRKKNDRGIFKKIINKKTKKVIPIRKFMDFSFKYHDPVYTMSDLEFIENSPNEIYLAVKEFLTNLNRKKKSTGTSLQIKFRQLQKKRFFNFFNENNEDEKSLLNCVLPIERIRIFKSSKGLFCNSYLKKNFS